VVTTNITMTVRTRITVVISTVIIIVIIIIIIISELYCSKSGAWGSVVVKTLCY